MKLSILAFAIYALAVYRLAVLLSDDSGPFKLIAKFRAMLKREERTSKVLKSSDIAKGVGCIRCNSIWLATPIASYAVTRHLYGFWTIAFIDSTLLALALSALAIIFNRAWPEK